MLFELKKKLEYEYYKEMRGNRLLVIFPEKPFWFVGDVSVEKIISYINNEISYDVLSDILKNDFNYTEMEMHETIDAIYELFNDASLFEKEKENTHDSKLFLDYFPDPVINVTRKCNLNCKHCYAEAGDEWNGEELSFSEIKNIIDQILIYYNLSDIDKRILLTGGEPFLRKDIMDIISYIYAKGATPLVNTNSILIKDEYMDVLRKTRTELLVSLDGAREETHDFLRGKGAFKKTLARVKKLKKAGVITKLSMTVHSKNIQEVESFVSLAEELNADGIALNMLNVLSRAKQCGIKRVKLINFNNELQRISQKSEKFFNYISTTDYANLGAILLMNLKFDYCGVGAASLVIDYNGDLYPCYNNMNDESKLGNIRNDDMMQIWKNSPILNELRDLNVNNFSSKCKNCPIKYYCGGGCRGEAYFENHEYNSCCPYCEDMREGIINLMFELGEHNNKLFYNRIKYYEDVKGFYLHR